MFAPDQRATTEVLRRLSKWSLKDVKSKLVKDGTFSSEEVDAVEAEYKKYMALCITCGGSLPTPPMIDRMWHAHILFTQDYASMCQQITRSFIHHCPFVGDEVVDLDGGTRMLGLYRMLFGDEPNKYWGSWAHSDDVGSATCSGKGCMNNGTRTCDMKNEGLCSPNPNCQGKSVGAIPV